jgi:hypothetical protein
MKTCRSSRTTRPRTPSSPLGTTSKLRSFTECFSALGRFNLDQEHLKAKFTSEQLARNVTNRHTPRSSKRLSSSTARPPDLARPLSLLKTLYGPKLSSYAGDTPPLIEDPEFLRGIQAFYLVADPRANPMDDRGKVVVTRDGPSSRSLLPIPEVEIGIEIEMGEISPPSEPPPPPRAPTPPPIPPPPEVEL